MRVTLKQSDIISGIALYLGSIGMASVRPEELVIDFSITRKDNAGLIATFDIPERTAQAASAPASCGEAPVAVQIEEPVAPVAVVVEPVVEPVAEEAPVSETIPVDPVAEAKPAVADEAQPETGKVSLFG